MAVNKRLLQGAAAAGALVPSEHFGVVLYEGDGSSSHSINGGKFGAAFYGNGSNSRIDSTSIGAWPSGNASRTISFWMYSDSYANGGIVAYGTAASNQGFAFYIASSQLIMTFYGVNASINYALSAGQWYHVVATHDGTTFKAYINGSQEYSDTRTLNTGTTAFRIGGVPWNNGGEFFNGKIDQVRVFNKALSASEVTTLYNENSLVASYRFEGNANDDTRNYDGSASNVTYEYGFGFTPDWLFTKRRDSAGSWLNFDSSRGASKYNFLNLTDAEGTGTNYLLSFDDGGFTVGNNTGINTDGADYVAFGFKANGGTTSSNTDGNVTTTVQVNQDAGFSIVEFSTSSPASTDTIGHGLSAAPELILTKTLSAATDWYCWHTGIGTSNYLILNSTSAKIAFSNLFNSVTSTNFQYRPSSTAQDYIAYCFHSVDGFSSFGSYTGNGSTDGPIIETGFEPAMVILKRTDTADSWYIYDNKRDLTNPKYHLLLPDTNNSEFVNQTTYALDFLSNGFQIKNTAIANSSGGTYIYMAFAADPDTEAPPVAKSFSTITYTGNGTSLDLDTGFKPGLIWTKPRSYADNNQLWDIVRGAGWTVYSNSTNAENPTIRLDGVSSFNDDGFSIGNWNNINVNGSTYVAWAWKADDNEPTITGGPAVAAYKFEDNSNDVAGNYNGSDVNMTYTSSGKFNKAAVFNGTNGYITLPNGSFTFNDFSLSVWIYPTTSTGLRMIFENYEATSGSKGISTRLNSDNTVNLQAYNSDVAGNRYVMSTTTTVTTNQWNHLVFVLSKTYGQGRIFINGEEASYASGREYGPFSFYSNAPSTIGATRHLYASGGYEYPFVGRMDQMRFFNGVLSDADVTALYAEASSDNDNLGFVEAASSIVSANANAGFSIVKYKGGGVAGQKIPHGLSAAPEMIIIKNLDDIDKWAVYHSAIGATKFLVLNETALAVTSSAYWNNTAPTSTVFTVGATPPVNSPNNENYIAYCFHSVAGYSKFGSYTGTGSTGNSVTGLGFQPDWIMIKNISISGQNWTIYDSVRGGTVFLQANNTGVEATGRDISFDSNGFTVNNTDSNTNGNGNTMIYMAFKIN